MKRLFWHKKLILMILAITVAFSAAACGLENDDESDDKGDRWSSFDDFLKEAKAQDDVDVTGEIDDPTGDDEDDTGDSEGNSGNQEDDDQTSGDDLPGDEEDIPGSDITYFDVDQIDGSFHASDETAVAWEKNGLIKSEVKVFMDTVYWTTDYNSETTEIDSDLDGDGERDEYLAIEYDSAADSISLNLSMNNKKVNLFNLLSEEFYGVAGMLADSNYDFVPGTGIDAACIDLDEDNKKEIVIALGNDNGVLAVSVLKYVGGNNLYKEIGGIKGTKELRYIILTTRNTIFAELHFTYPPSNDPFASYPMNYVEFALDNGALKLTRYRDE